MQKVSRSKQQNTKVLSISRSELQKKDHIKISQFTKFGDLSLDCNHVEGFQKSEIAETLYVFEGCNLEIRDISVYGIWVTFDTQ